MLTVLVDSETGGVGRTIQTRWVARELPSPPCNNVQLFLLANQFRALEEDEVAFLDSVQEKHDAEQRQRQQIEGEEVKGYRESVSSCHLRHSLPQIYPFRAVAAHHTASKPRPPQPSAAIEPPKPKPAPRKEVKKTLKGVVVKKKAKSTTTKRKEPAEETVEPDAKRRKESDS